MPKRHYTRHPFYSDVIIHEYEEWRDIKGWEGLYQVSNRGRVRSLARTVFNQNAPYHKPGRVLRPGKVNKRGYLIVQLRRGGKAKCFLVYYLVLETFVCRRPDGMEALHYDDDKDNNRLENLRWGTHRENEADAIRNGKITVGEKHYSAKSTNAEVRLVRKLFNTGRYTQRQLAHRFGRSEVWVHKVVHYKQWKHI